MYKYKSLGEEGEGQRRAAFILLDDEVAVFASWKVVVVKGWNIMKMLVKWNKICAQWNSLFRSIVNILSLLFLHNGWWNSRIIFFLFIFLYFSSPLYFLPFFPSFFFLFFSILLLLWTTFCVTCCRCCLRARYNVKIRMHRMRI